MSTSSSKKRGPFWRTDWFVAIMITAAVLVLHQLTGTIDTLERRFYDFASEEAPDVRVLRPDIPERLAKVVALSLSKRPEARYQDGERFAADLRSTLDELAVASSRPGGSPGYDAPEAAPARANEVFAKTNVMSKPARPGGPATGDAKTDLEALPGKL